MSGLREEVFRSPSHAMALSHSSSAQSPSPAATLVVSPYTHTHSWSLPRSWSLSFIHSALSSYFFLSLAHTRCLSHSLRLSLSLSLIHFSDPPPARLRWLSLTLPSSPSLAVSPSLDCLSHNRSLPLLSLLLSHTHFSIAPLTRSMSHSYTLLLLISLPLLGYIVTPRSPPQAISLSLPLKRSPSLIPLPPSHSLSLSFVAVSLTVSLSLSLVVSLSRTRGASLSLTRYPFHSFSLLPPPSHSLLLSRTDRLLLPHIAPLHSLYHSLSPSLTLLLLHRERERETFSRTHS